VVGKGWEVGKVIEAVAHITFPTYSVRLGKVGKSVIMMRHGCRVPIHILNSKEHYLCGKKLK
jgi:hypothetical protein